MRQQLPRTSGESHLLGLAGVQQAPIELSQYRIKSGGYQRSHVESRTHLGSTSPDGTFAAIRTTISIEGRHTDQSRDLLAVQLAQLRQICEQCQRHLRPHAGYTAQQVVLLTPCRTTLYPLSQVGVSDASSSQSICMLGRTSGAARLRRFFSATRIITSTCAPVPPRAPACRRPVGAAGRTHSFTEMCQN